MISWTGKRTVVVISACQAADGTPDFALTEVEVTQDEYENGVHYGLVEDRLTDKDCEEPFVHFDEFDAPAWLIPTVRNHLDLSDRPHLTVYQPEDS